MRYLLVKVLLTVSPFPPSFSRQPCVYPPSLKFCSQPCGLSHAVSYSCGLFVVAKKVNSFIIKQIHTLFTKHPGWGYLCDISALSASLRYRLPFRANFLTPLPATHPKSAPKSYFLAPINPSAATHTNWPYRKSFPCHTYKKRGCPPPDRFQQHSSISRLRQIFCRSDEDRHPDRAQRRGTFSTPRIRQFPQPVLSSSPVRGISCQ
jgi:hypothetical protein